MGAVPGLAVIVTDLLAVFEQPVLSFVSATLTLPPLGLPHRTETELDVLLPIIVPFEVLHE
jgi:hypothetical protein